MPVLHFPSFPEGGKTSENLAFTPHLSMAPPPGIVEVRCAGCEETLEVEHGLMEFACPDCGTAQALPPELMPRRPRRALPLPGRAPFSATPSRVSCGGCGAVLSVPHGHGSFSCPLCGIELAASQAAAVSVIAPPAAIPITPNRPAQTSEVLTLIVVYSVFRYSPLF